MSFGEHLEELRRTILHCLAVTAVAFVLLFVVAREPLMRLVLRPIQNVAEREEARAEKGEDEAVAVTVQALAPTSRFVAYLKVTFVAAIFLSFPILSILIWRFVGAGLYDRERRYVYLVAPASVVLFLAGAVFCYLVMLPYALRFLLTYGDAPIETGIDIRQYISFFLNLELLMGAVFQIPLVSLFLQKAGIVEAATLRHYRRHAILVMAAASAVFTPQDPWTLLFALVPMVLLYELGIWAGKVPL
jgi:sec-independent protein translocase protein TatC